MDPRKTTVGAGEVIELRLLTDPENAQHHETHHVHDKARGKRDWGAPQFALAVHGFHRRHAEVEYQERHRNCENPVTQSGQLLHALACNVVAGKRHSRFPRS